MKSSNRAAGVALASGAALVMLAACSSGGSSASATSASATTGAAAANGSGSPGARANLYADPKVQACLKAAGIAVPSGRAFPSGARRSGARPSGARPSDGALPSAPASAAPRTGAPRSGGAEASEFAKVRTALTACGITLPSRAARPSGSPGTGATPTASPS